MMMADRSMRNHRLMSNRCKTGGRGGLCKNRSKKVAIDEAAYFDSESVWQTLRMKEKVASVVLIE